MNIPEDVLDTMATVFQRPMSVLSDAQSSQIIPQRRRRDSVEVIDVDSLDDDLYRDHRGTSAGPSRPAQARRVSAPSEIISLLDSDDDEPIVSGSIQPASRTRLQSPPPRNQPWLYVPPVPPVPPRYTGHTSFPIPRQQAPPSTSPPVVRPNHEPFPFEANMRQQASIAGPSNRSIYLHGEDGVLPPRPLQSAPPSHHAPAMGLGGALIAQNRSRHQTHQATGGSSFLGRLGNAVGSGARRFLGGPAGGPRSALNLLALGNNFGFLDDVDEEPGRLLTLHLLGEGGEGLRDLDPAFNPARAYIRGELQRRRNREESPYRPEYTHPHPPEAGFTNDFAPKPVPEVIDVTSPSPNKQRALFSEPIIIDDSDDPAASPDAGASSITEPSSSSLVSPKHQPSHSVSSTTMLVCARCLDPLVLSNSLTSRDQKNRRIWGLRCGHLLDGKCLKEIAGPPGGDDPGIAAKTKGKGKAKAIDGDEDEDLDNQVHPHVIEPLPAPDFEADNIRSRLRPRQTNALASSSSSLPPAPSGPYQRKRGANARRQPPIPLPEFMWHCPVSGCGRVHVSVKINKEWVPDRDDDEFGESSNVAGTNRRRRGGRGRARDRLSLGGLFGGGAGDDNAIVGDSEGPRGAILLFL